MNVTGLSGSPRPDGNTVLLLEKFLEGALSRGAKIEKFDLARLKISPCWHCDACAVTGRCRQADDMDRVYASLKEADVIALASPLHFMTVTSHLKLAIDRCQALWACKYTLGLPPLEVKKERNGIFISVGGQKGSHIFDAARVTVKSLFTSLDVNYRGDLLYSGIDEKGAIARHPAALKEAFEMGARLAGEQS